MFKPRPKSQSIQITPARGQIWREARTGRLVVLRGQPETDEPISYIECTAGGQPVKKRGPGSRRRQYFVTDFVFLREAEARLNPA